MSEPIKPESISRRKAILLLGLGAIFTLDDAADLPAMAQEAAPAVGGTAATPEAGGTAGMQRRQGRRTHRHERRNARRRHRHTGGTEPAATAPAGTAPTQ